MREKLLIYSHNAHPFLYTEVQESAKLFTSVDLICPYDKSLLEITTCLCNVRYTVLPKLNTKQLFRYCLRYFFSLFSPDNIHELLDACRAKKLSVSYLKVYFGYFYLVYYLKEWAKKVSINNSTASEWVILSGWYAGTAYAAVKLKQRYPNLTVASLAHSFEIDAIKNSFTELLYRRHYHNELSMVSFISENVMNTFKDGIAKKLNLGTHNCMTLHLGTYKLLEGECRSSEDGILRILSCSNVIKVKRVALILEALDAMRNTKVRIEWTHIGSGALQEALNKQVNQKTNENLDVKLQPRFPSLRLWHQYYIDNPVDIFINLSESEGIPVTIMEAEAYGVPVIATDVGGNAEAIDSSFGRLLSASPSTKEVCDAIIGIMNTTTEERNAMKSSAKAFFETNYNASKIRPYLYNMLKNT